MSYYSYARATREHIFELFRSISPKESVKLSTLLTDMGHSGWYAWQQEYAKDIFAYLQAIPAERKKKKKWQHPETIVLLKYSAYKEANKAYSLLYAIGVNYLPEGCSNREMTRAALTAYYYTTYFHFPEWPFASTPPPWIDDPFSHYGDERLDY